ncbi:glycosyl transferase family protein [Neoasaia chiangmaiensis]|nr:glycosyltransferase [Neoasaia chiangmaiensis]GEN14340.1 glycosyl transferase family protein [Neoasaia chiangmaiensis]
MADTPAITLHQPSMRESDLPAASIATDETPDDIHLWKLRRECRELSTRLAAIENSTIWRGTAPLRALIERLPWLARMAAIARRRTRRATPHADEVIAAPRELRQHIAGLHARTAHRVEDAVEPITFQTVSSPRVSIIIPTYGQDDYTLRCLASLALHAPQTPFEIIVMDDAYPDRADPAFFAKHVRGIEFRRAAHNLGFLRTCNAAAELARGDYLFFLNNDTEPMPGAIDALVALLDETPTIGMTGAKLIYPNGTLQEAGGIVWRDASGWNWGRGQNPESPEYNYRRDVDYISGAAIMLRRTLFESLHGFDETFAPAYYEDTDLAFRIRQAGLRVVYEPRAAVIHYEGISHGTDEATGGKAHQRVNARRMREQWAEVLDQDYFAGPDDLPRARDRAMHRRIILVIDHYVPEPDRDAGSRTIMGVLRSLVAANWVVKFWPQNRLYSPVYTPVLQDMGIEVIDSRWQGDLEDWLLARGDALDCILVSRPAVASAYLPALMACTEARLCLYGHDLHGVRLHRQAELTGDPDILRRAETMDRQECRLWRIFDASIYLSRAEADIASKLEPRGDYRVVVPYCFPTFTGRDHAPATTTILMVAGFAHPPNEDAALFMARQVLPLIHEQCPEATLVLAGSHPTTKILALASPNITVTGWIDDKTLHDLYQTSRAAVVPLRYGAGVKGKTVEALHEGLPLTVTPIGAEGIEGLDAILPICPDARSIADDLLLLLRDDRVWLARSHAQTDFARAHFSEEAMRESVIAALMP